MSERTETSSAPIIVGVDGADIATEALRWAAGAAANWGCGLQIVHALPSVDPYLGEAVVMNLASIRDEIRAQGTKILADAGDLARRTAPELDVVTEMTEQPIAEYLEKASLDARLIVLGRQRSSALSDLVLGSECIRITRSVQCPVLLYRYPPGLPVSRGAMSIAVGIDYSENSKRALNVAFGYAERFGVGLTVARFWAPSAAVFGLGADLVDWTQTAEVEREALREEVAESAREHPEVETTLVCESIGATVGLQRLSGNAHLVVVGTHGRGALRGALLGSVSQYLIHHAASSVLVVP